MNTKFLIFTSFLIALLCHLFIFSFCTVIFSIDSAEPKPKFFFLGPILKQSDVDQGSPKDDTDKKDPVASNNFGHKETALKNIYYEIADPDKNPFTIKTIEKPLVPQTTKTQEKVLIKSTFQADAGEEPSEELKTQDSDQELNLQPYRPLRSRLP